MQFGRGYVCLDKGVIHDVEFIFDGDKLTARCTCNDCTGGRVCRHIERYLSQPPMRDVSQYPLVVERIKHITQKLYVGKD